MPQRPENGWRIVVTSALVIAALWVLGVLLGG
jgi:hypothetical protein